jgi:DNA-binding GntR family transcriptional regulator
MHEIPAPLKTTAYNRIAASIRDRILSGTWDENEKLPTERELCEEFKSSRITIRHALQILEEEGLAERRQGSGTFVRPTVARKIPLLTTDFFGSIEKHAPDLTRVVASWQETPAADEVARSLYLPSNHPVMEAVRVDLLGVTPVATDQLHLIRDYAEALSERDLCDLNFLDTWARKQRLDVTHCTQLIEAVQAQPRETRLLALTDETVLLKETNVVFIAGNVAAGLFVSHYRHDYFRFDATVDLRSRVRTNHRNE